MAHIEDDIRTGAFDMSMTNEHLSEIEQRAQFLTTPWEAQPIQVGKGGRKTSRYTFNVVSANPDYPGMPIVKSLGKGNADFIANAPQDVVELVAEIRRLHENLKDLYTATQMSRKMLAGDSAPTEGEIKNYTEMIDDLLVQTAQTLNLEPDEEIECGCKSEMAWIIGFHGWRDRADHIHDCPDCGHHTLHVGDDWQRCINSECGALGGADAEGNVYSNGKIISNGGRSIDELRSEYFDGYSFIL